MIADLRIGYAFKSDHRISFHVLNITNSFVTIRTAKPEAPRTFVMQLSATIRQKRKNCNELMLIFSIFVKLMKIYSTSLNDNLLNLTTIEISHVSSFRNICICSNKLRCNVDQTT